MKLLALILLLPSISFGGLTANTPADNHNAAQIYKSSFTASAFYGYGGDLTGIVLSSNGDAAFESSSNTFTAAQTFNSSVTASSFYGDGRSLTGVVVASACATVALAGTQAVGSGGGFKPLYFDTEVVDTRSMWSVSVSSELITIATNYGGLYDVSGNALFTLSAIGSRYVQIVKNASTVLSQGLVSANSAGDDTIVGVPLKTVSLIAGDTIKMLVYQDSTADRNLGGAVHTTYLTVCKRN